MLHYVALCCIGGCHPSVDSHDGFSGGVSVMILFGDTKFVTHSLPTKSIKDESYTKLKGRYRTGRIKQQKI